MDYSSLAPRPRIDATIAALTARGVAAEYAATRADALARIQAVIPAGATVSTGASLTLREIGFEELFAAGRHPWKNLKAEFLAEKDPGRQAQLRRQSVLADWYLGSAHAVTETGEIAWASMTGSQLAPYAYAASNTLWVVGAQKIVPDAASALDRIRTYILPHENERQLASTGGKMGSMIGKILLFEREAAFLKRKLVMIIVGERVGD